MKIKEVCEKTGLTDRTVRYYIDEELIFPFYTENYLGRKSFDFSEEDVKRLKSIATLRAFGFSIEEIKQLSVNGDNIRQILEAVKKRLEESLDENSRRLSALSALELSDCEDMSQLAEKLSNYKAEMDEEIAKPNWKKRALSTTRACAVFLAVWLPIISSIVVLVLRFSKFDSPIVRPVFFIYTLLCFLPSMITIFMLKGAKKPLRTILPLICILCLPFCILFSSKAVIMCEHQYETYHTVAKATCQRDGEAVMKCKNCGKFEEQSLEALPHTPIPLYGAKPTCTKSGLTDGSICSECETILVEQSVIPKGEHSYQKQEIAQSCGVDGCILYECACGDSYKTNIIPASNEHNFQKRNNVDYICLNCGLEVITHGNADGSIYTGNDKVQYYVIGDFENYKDFEIVIYGNGEMPNFTEDSLPRWHKYLPHTVTIRIEDGVTSIGSYAFYYPDSPTYCNFIMSDTVKTIKSDAISLKINNLTLGNGVETIESRGIGDVDAIYIPRSLKKLDFNVLGNETYFYEGSLEEFYQIQMHDVYSRPITVKDFLDSIDGASIANIYVYWQAENISDRSHLEVFN